MDLINISFDDLLESVSKYLKQKKISDTESHTIQTSCPELFYYGTQTGQSCTLCLNLFLSKSFLESIFSENTWSTVGNKPLVSLSEESLKNQIFTELCTVYCETKVSGFDYVMEFLEEMMSSDRIEVRIFGCWLKTHKHIAEIINIFLTEVFYIVNTADTLTGRMIDLKTARPDRCKFEYLPVPELFEKLAQDSVVSRYFLYYWNNVPTGILLQIWDNFLHGQKENSNPFEIIMEEAKYVFGTGKNNLTKKSIVGEMTFSKVFLSYYVLSSHKISKTEEKVRSKIFDVWA